VLGGSMLFLMAFASSFNSLLLLILLASLFGEAYRPAIGAAVGHHTKASETGRSMAVIRLAINLGMGVAPAVAGFMAVFMSYQWLFWFDSFTCIAAAGYLWYKAKQWHTSPEEPQDISISKEAEETKAPSENRSYLLFLLATLLLAFGFVQWFHTVPLFIKSVWGFDERYIGALKGMSSLLIVLFELPLVHAIEISRKVKIAVLLGTLFFALSFIPFMMGSSLGACVIAFVLVTAGEMTYLTFNNAIPLRMAPLSQRGAYISWYWMTWSLASIAGPYWGMGFIEQFGFQYFWPFIIGLLAISLVISWRLPVKA
jgi:MFS family permease